MIKPKTMDGYRQQGTIKDLAPNEKDQYLFFLDTAYKDNFKAAEYLLLKFPRWSIIAGYYAMHDVSKLLLAKKFNLKFSQPQVHAAVIQALRELVKRKDILNLIEKAEETYDSIISLHLALLQGKEEREKSQYYSSVSSKPGASVQKASFFLDKLVKQYIELVEEIMKNDS